MGVSFRENMQELRMSVEDLLSNCGKGCFVLSDVTYAIVETNGTLSVVKKAAVDYLRPRKDMGVKGKDEGLEVVVVSDGDLSVGSMHLCGKMKSGYTAY